MSHAWESQIIRVTSGRLNTADDSVIGGVSGISGASKFSGQLGKTVSYSADQMSAMYDSSVGTLYYGRFRYVRFRAGDDDSPAIGVGKIMFWDTTVATDWWNYFQVTRDENLSSADNAVAIAGICISVPTQGNYGFIQDQGLVPVRMRAVLTVAGAIGSRVYAAGAGDTGNDQGTADTLTTDSTSLANVRKLGWAPAAPVGGALANVNLDFTNVLAMG